MSIAIREITNRAPAITIGLGLLIILAFFLPFVNPVSSQDSLKLSFEPENWTDDMKRVKITTLERGLRIRVDIENLDAKDYLVIDYLKIRIETRYEEEDFYAFHYIEVKNIAVPPNNATSTYADVDLRYIQGSLGNAQLHLGNGL
jgi:hypothetical protein